MSRRTAHLVRLAGLPVVTALAVAALAADIWTGPSTDTASGQGWLHVGRTEGGDQVWIAIALDSPVRTRYHVTTHRVFRIMTGVDLSPAALNDRTGRIVVNCGREHRLLTIHGADGRLLLAVALHHYRAGEAPPELLRLADGTPLVVGALQISQCDYDAEPLAPLAPARREGPGPEGLEDAGLRALHALLKDQLDAPPPPVDCNACTAGGPGSTSCSIAGCPQIPHDCSTECRSGYACCRCSGTTSGFAQCGCCSSGGVPGSPGGGK